MKAKYLLTTLAITILATGCGKTLGDPGSSLYGSDGASLDQTQDQTTEENDDVSSYTNMPEEAITDEEKKEFTTLFLSFEYAGFLTSPFNDTSELDWDDVLEHGADIQTSEFGENEVELYLDTTNQSQLFGTLFKIPRNDLEEYSKSHAGIDFNPSSDSFHWTYIEETDSYYREQYEFELSYEFECIEGIKQGNLYTLKFRNSMAVYNYGYDADRVLKLIKDGDNITVISNEILWEDNCDQSQTFDIELNPDDGPVRFITYNVDSAYGVEFVIVKDKKLDHSLSSYINDGDNWGYLTSVSAISFFDFNADNVKDIVVIGSSDYGTKVILYQSVNGDSYESFYYLPEKIEEAYGDSVTIDQVKTYLMGENKDCVYNSYQEAYAQIARLYNLEKENNTYDLIYFDNDDIPELVVGEFGYDVYLFSYKNGHAVCYMLGWPYGIMGNTGYYYSPKNSLIHNSDYDYAGAVQYDSYFTNVSDDSEVKAICSSMYVWYEDADGDGYPSEEELESCNYETIYEEGYFDDSDQCRSADEIKKLIESYNQYAYEEICGELSLSELLNQLGF